MVATAFQYVKKANHVACEVGIWVGYGISYTCLCCKIDYLVEMFFGKQFVKGGLVFYSQTYESKVGELVAGQSLLPWNVRCVAC